jgi:hypothetical protein
MRSGYLSMTATSAGQVFCLLAAPAWQLTEGFPCLPRHRAEDRCRSRRAERAWPPGLAGWRWK